MRVSIAYAARVLLLLAAVGMMMLLPPRPAGLDLGPAIPAADKALSTGSTEALEKLLGEALRQGLRDHFDYMKQRPRLHTGTMPSLPQSPRRRCTQISSDPGVLYASFGSTERTLAMKV